MTSAQRRQRARCAALVSAIDGASLRHDTSAMGQRDENRQASGEGSLAGNTAPGMLLSASVGPASPGGVGMQRSSPAV